MSVSFPTSTGSQIGDAKAMLEQRWKKALEKCRSDLSPADFQSIQQFDSPGALLDDLQNREAEYSMSWQGRASANVLSVLIPTVRSLESISIVFMMATVPYKPSLVCFWGSLHLLTKISLASQEIWNDLYSKIEKIQRQLEILDRCAQCFPTLNETHEMSEAVLSVFTSLVRFWFQAVKWNRQQPRRPFNFPRLNRKFEVAILKVEDTIKHVTSLLDIAMKAKGGAELLQNIGLAEENVDFPLIVLPRAASQMFYGRDEIFMELDKVLDPSSNPNNLRSVLLYGMAGVGKTSTALQYAHRKPSTYDAVFWIKSETVDVLHKSFTQIALSLKLPGSVADGQDEQNLLYLKNWLRTQEARQENGRKWLFIFDNCDNIDIINNAQVLSTSGSVIITSRYAHVSLSDTTNVSLRPFKIDDGLVLLKNLLPEKLFTNEEEDSLKILLQDVDGLPLGIRVLAALVKSRKCALTEYPQFFKKHSRKLFIKADTPEDYHGKQTQKEHVLDRIWLMSFRPLTFEAKSLLGMMSFISSEDILPSIFQLNANQIGVDIEEPSVLSICEDEFELDQALDDLLKAALIDKTTPNQGGPVVLSAHRLIQEAFIYNCEPADRQKFFDAAVRVIYEAFPKQINGAPLHEQWSKCRAGIQHGISLAERFMEFRGPKIPKPLLPPPELGELLKNCAWYKYEMADYDSALSILATAQASCANKESELYAHLLNTEGGCYYDLNDLQKCRQVWEIALELRKNFARSGNPNLEEDYAIQLGNFANLETAEGNLDASLVSFDKSESIRIKMGSTSLISLGLVHTGIGRAYFEKGELDKVEPRYQMAEDLFVKGLGPRSPFMADLQYARGNLEVKRRNVVQGRKFYDESQGILNEEESTKYHILRSANYYKIACLQIEENKHEDALKSLAQGRHIAELRGAIGEAARIIRKQAYVYSLRPGEDSQRDYKSHRQHADLMRSRCPGAHASLLKFEDSDEKWNKLVCGYYR